MKFEVGKCYEHNSGRRMHVVTEAELDCYISPCLIAERDDGELMPIDTDSEAAINWYEITRNEWLNTFKSSFIEPKAITKIINCPTCSGTGMVPSPLNGVGLYTCPRCNGYRKVFTEEEK